jgi:hypothetical protein
MSNHCVLRPLRPELEVDTAASILHGVKIVQIHNITKKPAKIYVPSLYDFDAM